MNQNNKSPQVAKDDKGDRKNKNGRPGGRRPRNGAEAIIDFIKSSKIDLVFGYPGGAVIPLYDALYDSGVRHILTRHEQGAIHAADGYARASGKVGVVLATSGPGATNLVTGLATAYMDSVPILAITGQVALSSLGSDSFQEADIYGISIPVTKYNYLIKKPQTLPSILNEAYYLASSGRPGPVLVDVPKDIQVAEVTAAPQRVDIPGYDPRPKPDVRAIDSFVEHLDNAKRPILYLGGGATIANVTEEIKFLAESQDMAVVVTLQAKGIFPDDHQLCLGLPGMHGAKYANLAINESDLIVGLGVRFDDRVVGNVQRFAPYAKIAHFDIDPAEIGKRLSPDTAVVGDLKEALELVCAKVKKKLRGEWRERINSLRISHGLVFPDGHGEIKPQRAIGLLSEACGPDTVLVTDVGQHQMWAAQNYRSLKPRKFLSSGGMGTMGFGLPASIGAQFALPEGQIVLITGDGSFQMCLQELATVMQYNLPIKIMLINNGCLGMVRQWQQFFFNRRYSQTIFNFNPDFVALAKVYGLGAEAIDKASEVSNAIERMLSYDGPYLLEVKILEEENVMPLIPAGMGQTDFFELEEEGR
ncbi:MAG: biosynthetic-type acetolactate synthase large subunit [Deltaproteobacteria bacterium]|jgi:acetolactate synthase-1/2/3 large subunit|nr:biosynthetic-type acetolactate synthase large subunit [Deltaproteobacteria bacterium]